jgi:hypothetical protein
VGFPTQEMEEIFHPVTWRPNTWFLRKLGLYVPFFWLPKLVPQIEFLRRNKGSPDQCWSGTYECAWYQHQYQGPFQCHMT